MTKYKLSLNTLVPKLEQIIYHSKVQVQVYVYFVVVFFFFLQHLQMLHQMGIKVVVINKHKELKVDFKFLAVFNICL